MCHRVQVIVMLSPLTNATARLDPDSEFEDEEAQVVLPDDFDSRSNYKALTLHSTH